MDQQLTEFFLDHNYNNTPTLAIHRRHKLFFSAESCVDSQTNSSWFRPIEIYGWYSAKPNYVAKSNLRL